MSLDYAWSQAVEAETEDDLLSAFSEVMAGLKLLPCTDAQFLLAAKHLAHLLGFAKGNANKSDKRATVDAASILSRSAQIERDAKIAEEVGRGWKDGGDMSRSFGDPILSDAVLAEMQKIGVHLSADIAAAIREQKP